MQKEQTSKLMPLPKEPFYLEVGNIGLTVPKGASIASGWNSWFATDGHFQKPEYVAVELEESERVQGIRSDSRYDAGLWQQVKTLPGLALVFTMNFRVDPCSETNAERPEGIVVGVGIDPYGGDNPRSDNVQWALRDLEYSKVVTASVTAIAQSEVVTAFVRSIAFIPGSTAAAGNGTANNCSFTCARIPYDRTYLLLYPGASPALWQRAAQVARAHNWTLGASADDAGLGQDTLLRRTVIAVDPERWDPADPLSLNWFITHYPPGSNLVFSGIREHELDTL